ncbi:MAG: hypothetical protein WCA32_10250 [Chromatiaceae bacterium]
MPHFVGSGPSPKPRRPHLSLQTKPIGHEIFFAAVPLIGVGLIVAGVIRWCGMANLLARMSWNPPVRYHDEAAARF